MNVLILGYGKVGYVLVKLLLKERAIETIICGDIHFKRRTKHKKIQFKIVDASDKNQLQKLFKNLKVDLVINTALPHFNISLLEFCLHKKIDYMDLASYCPFDPDPNEDIPYQELSYDFKFKKKNLIGLVNAGVSPGLTNLLVRECADALDKIDTIKIRLIEDTGNKELCFAWSKEWMLDEIASKSLVYQNGRFKVKDNFSEEEEEFNFPSPFGKKKVYLTSQEEVGTIPFFIKTKNLNIKAYDSQSEISKFLFKSGLVSEKKIKLGKVKISPFEFLSIVLPDTPNIHKDKKLEGAVFGISVEVYGKKKNKLKKIRYSAVFPSQKEINQLRLSANFISYPTALMTKLFILSFPKIRRTGVFPPECLDKEVRESILDQLRNEGVKLLKNF